MKKIIATLLLLMVLPGCSLVMSSKKATQHDIIEDAVKKGASKQVVDNALGAPVKFTKTKDGYIAEYAASKDPGAGNRLIINAVLDVVTAFIWELPGTIIELNINKPNLLVEFDKNQLVK